MTNRGAFIAAMVVAAMALAWVTSSRAVLFTNDGGQHLYSWVAGLHLDDARRFGDWVVDHEPPTSRGAKEIFTVLEPMLGWERAYRATAATIALGWAIAFAVLIVTSVPRRRWLAVLGVPLALQGGFYFGFLPFLLGSTLVMLGWASLWSGTGSGADADRSGRWRRVVLAALLFAAAAHCHIIAAAIGGVVLGVVAFATAAPHARSRAFLELCAVGCWPVIVALLTWRTGADLGASAATAPLDGVARILGVGNALQPGPPWRNVAGLLIPVLAVATALVHRRELSARDAACAALGSLLVIVSLLLPRDFAGWGGAGYRILPFGVVLTLVACPLEALRPPLRTAIVVGAVAYGAASLVWASAFSRQVMAEHGPFLDALSTWRPSPRHWYAMTTAGDNARRATPFPAPVAPSARVPQLASLALGGFVDGSHATLPSAHHLALRPGRTSLTAEVAVLPGGDEEVHLGLVPQVVTRAARFEGMLFFSPSHEPQLRRAFEDAGLVVEQEGGGLLAYRFDGCPATIVLHGPPGAQVPVEIGVWPSREPVHRMVRHLDTEGTATIEFPRFPCMEGWVFPTAGRCRGAPDGPLRQALVDRALRLECTLE